MESSPVLYDCPRDVRKMLEQCNGVESISIDPKRGMVRVIGKVNPMKLVKLLQKMGQRAELWSFQKAPHQAKSYSQTKRHTNDYHIKHSSRCCCHDDDDSSSSISSSSSFSTDSDARDNYRGYASKNGKVILYTGNTQK